MDSRDKTQYLSVAGLCVLMNNMDAALTLVGTRYYGAAELNPIWAAMIHLPLLFVIIKNLSMGAILCYIWKYSKWYLLKILSWVLCLVCVWNSLVILC